MKEEKLYVIRTNKAGFEYKIANHNHPQVCPQDGVILIEGLKRDNFKQPRTTISKVFDPSTGITYGNIISSNAETEDFIFQRIIVNDFMQLDMKNENDRKIWTVLSRAPFMEGSPYKSPHRAPMYKKIDKDAEANRIIKTAKERRRATEIAEELTGADLYDMAINLGLSVENNNLNTLMASIIMKAEKDPEGFLAIYDNVNKGVITVFNRAKAVGLIKLDVTNGYVWKDTYPLGMNETLAIKTIATNPTLLQNMDLLSKQHSNFFKSVATEKQMQPINVGNNYFEQKPEEKGFMTDSDIEKKMQSLREMEERLKAQEQKAVEAFSKLEEKSKALDIELEKKKNSEFENSTIEELQKKAFSLGWAGANLTTDKEKLITEIAKRSRKK